MNKVLIALGVLVLIIIAFVFIPRKAISPTPSTSYSSAKYGISFTIPKDYIITEYERGTGERGHYAITLIKKEDDVVRENSEGPTAITVDIFQNNIDKQSLSNWFYNSNNSNGKLTRDGTYASTTINGLDAITYRWSGLYEGETVAFEHRENIIMMSVTYISPADRNIPAFREVINSLKLN